MSIAFAFMPLLATPLPVPPAPTEPTATASAETDADASITLRPTPDAPAARAAEQPFVAVDGLYPLWEQTGRLDAAGAARVGCSHAAVGMGPVSVDAR